MMDEDWHVLTSFFPKPWRDLAASTGALKGLRQDKSAENLLRTILIHTACGYSLRETVVRARKANLADLSDVALLKRLRKSKDWLYDMCVLLFNERGLHLGNHKGIQYRLFDATTVKEPGKTGSLWRVHYSVQVPSLKCDFFKVTATKGAGTGESLSQYPIEAGDYIIADRGYSTANSVHYATSRGAFVSIRLNAQSVVMLDAAEKTFSMVDAVSDMTTSGEVNFWQVLVPGPNQAIVSARICAIRKSEEAIRLAHKKLHERAIHRGQKLNPETLILAKYVLVLTTFPQTYSAPEILELYRVRWQVELIFKRFKQITDLGHLPKHDDESSIAWLYGKLFAALVTEKIIHYSVSISPWGYELEERETTKSVA